MKKIKNIKNKNKLLKKEIMFLEKQLKKENNVISNEVFCYDPVIDDALKNASKIVKKHAEEEKSLKQLQDKYQLFDDMFSLLDKYVTNVVDLKIKLKNSNLSKEIPLNLVEKEIKEDLKVFDKNQMYFDKKNEIKYNGSHISSLNVGND